MDNNLEWVTNGVDWRIPENRNRISVNFGNTRAQEWEYYKQWASKLVVGEANSQIAKDNGLVGYYQKVG